MYDLARITARENRMTWREYEIAWNVRQCLTLKRDAYQWWCEPGHPCHYCKRTREITNGL